MVVGELTQEADLLVIGGGPGGYHAAFRAAANGIDTTIIDASPDLGGVCLHRGCIPSKTYLSIAETLHLAERGQDMGIEFGKPKIDVAGVRAWKQGVVKKLTAGLAGLCKKHGVERLTGKARFESAKTIAVDGDDVSRVKFRRAIIATGSRSIRLGDIQIDSPRVMTSRGALELDDIPKTMLVVGGGYIGLELGQVYAALGTRVTVVEMTGGILPGADPDLARPLVKRLKGEFAAICLDTRVTGMKDVRGGVEVAFDGKHPPDTKRFDKVLVSVGRAPNTTGLDLNKAGVELDDRGFIKVDDGFRTTSRHIHAIGDVIGNPMLAHKAMHEGTVVADLIAGKDAMFEPRAIPAVVFTDPELAWAGYTEAQAKTEGIAITVKKLPWSASGRAVAIGRTDGLTKMIFAKSTQRLIGIGLTGPHAGEMIGEGVLAMEMGAVAYDIASAIHAHPTLSETLGEVAAMMPT
ncbi:MAG: dihydrolipoyl dehydrogenase [Phycisphaerae bacterium]